MILHYQMNELNTETNTVLIGHQKKIKKKKKDLIAFCERTAEDFIKAELPKKHSSFSHPRNDAEKSELPVKKEI